MGERDLIDENERETKREKEKELIRNVRILIECLSV